MIKVEIGGATLCYETKEDFMKDIQKLLEAANAEGWNQFTLHTMNQFDECTVEFNATENEQEEYLTDYMDETFG